MKIYLKFPIKILIFLDKHSKIYFEERIERRDCFGKEK